MKETKLACCGAEYQVSKSTRKGTRIFCQKCGKQCDNQPHPGTRNVAPEFGYQGIVNGLNRTPPTPTNDWEKEFDEKFIKIDEHGDKPVPPQIVKNFISRIISRIAQEEYNRGKKEAYTKAIEAVEKRRDIHVAEYELEGEERELLEKIYSGFRQTAWDKMQMANDILAALKELQK